MKRILLCLSLFFLLSLPIYGVDSEMRGMWVSTVYNLDYPSRPGLTQEQLQQEADAILKQAKEWEMNAIFLQVRPSADALYTSEIVPWSSVLSGIQGQAPASGFDPLAYFVEQCHAQNMELHAWLNPYRITRTAADSREAAFAQLCDSHPARKLTDYVVFHRDGCLYYDPGQPAVQQHILAVAEEILKNYAVDGIHLDDYFYPGSSFADDATFMQYGKDFSNIGDFRRDAVCQLVDNLHKLVAQLAPQAQFGVSPSGIWASSLRHPMGADTDGSQSYYDQYADSRRWVRECMVDYIAPQIYWEIGALSGDFEILLDWWCNTVKDTEVELYIGLAAYKAAQATQDSVWYGTDELQRQLEAIRQQERAKGAIFFRYGSLLTLDMEALSPPEEELSPPVPREALWPEDLTLEQPQGVQAVRSGHKLAISCTAPRYSKVSIFYGSHYTTLRTDCNGHYSGFLTAETPYETESYSAPALVCSEKFGILTVKLTPFTITSVQAKEPISIQEIQWTDQEDSHVVVFRTEKPCAATFDLRGDVLSVTFSPARMGVLFKDDYFHHMTLEQEEDSLTYRLIFPDDGNRRNCQLIWTPDQVTLRIRKNPQEPPEADR